VYEERKLYENLHRYFLGLNKMPKIAINTPAPNFTLKDFQGQPTQLSDFRGEQHVLLVFNRGFV
jgi:cytochrome oxidase Cu insertion factor (SCO1/SenC/PrrC family)